MSFTPVPVWSRAQRIIHWTIAFSVLIQIPLGLFMLLSGTLNVPDEGVDHVMYVHFAAGLALSAGVLARIIYLFAGPETSSWRDVIPYTRGQWAEAARTVRYYLSGFKGKAPLYFSHNGLAAIFDTVLLVFLITQAISGATLFLTHNEGQAHESAGASADPHEALEDMHILGAAVIIGFSLSHFAALGVHDVVEKRGLASSMISGDKFFSDEEIRGLKKRPKRPPGV